MRFVNPIRDAALLEWRTSGDRNGRASADNLWFEERVIVGETSRSWVTVNVGVSSQWKEPNGYAAWYVKRYATKVPKKGADIADAKTAMQYF